MKIAFITLVALLISLTSLGQTSKNGVFNLKSGSIFNQEIPDPDDGSHFEINNYRVTYIKKTKTLKLLEFSENGVLDATESYVIKESNMGAVLKISVTDELIYVLTEFESKKSDKVIIYSFTVDRKSKNVSNLTTIAEMEYAYYKVKDFFSPDQNVGVFIYDKWKKKAGEPRLIYVFNDKNEIMNEGQMKLKYSEYTYSLALFSGVDNEGNLAFIYRGYNSEKEASEGKTYKKLISGMNVDVFRRAQLGVLNAVIFFADDNYNSVNFRIPENDIYVREAAFSMFRPDSMLFIASYSNPKGVNFDGFISFWFNPFTEESVENGKISKIPYTLDVRLQSYDENELYKMKQSNTQKELLDWYSLSLIGMHKVNENYYSIFEEQISLTPAGGKYPYIHHKDLYVIINDAQGKIVNMIPINKSQKSINGYPQLGITSKSYDEKLYIIYEYNTRSLNLFAEFIDVAVISEVDKMEIDILDVSEMGIKFIDFNTGTPLEGNTVDGTMKMKGSNDPIKTFQLELKK